MLVGPPCCLLVSCTLLNVINAFIYRDAYDFFGAAVFAMCEKNVVFVNFVVLFCLALFAHPFLCRLYLMHFDVG